MPEHMTDTRWERLTVEQQRVIVSIDRKNATICWHYDGRLAASRFSASLWNVARTLRDIGNYEPGNCAWMTTAEQELHKHMRWPVALPFHSLKPVA
jgi:hypothetical protein